MACAGTRALLHPDVQHRDGDGEHAETRHKGPGEHVPGGQFRVCPDAGDQDQHQHHQGHLQRYPGARPAPVDERADARQPEAEDGAHDLGGQRGEMPGPVPDRGVRRREQQQAGGQREGAHAADESRGRRRQPRFAVGGGGVVPAVAQVDECDQERGGEVQTGPQPESQLPMVELVPVDERGDAEQGREGGDRHEATLDRVPVCGAPGAYEEVGAT
jgi:hypothetical protein